MRFEDNLKWKEGARLDGTNIRGCDNPNDILYKTLGCLISVEATDVDAHQFKSIYSAAKLSTKLLLQSLPRKL